MKKYLILICSVVSLPFSGCNSEWLDIKPDMALVVPNKIEDYQALLDNSTYFNNHRITSLEVSSDNYYVPDKLFSGLDILEQNLYLWKKTQDDFYSGSGSSDWRLPYEKIFQANIVIEGIEKISNKLDINAWNNVKGSALFIRAFNYFSMAGIFCNQFDENTSLNDLGLPLRVTANFNTSPKRSSLQETYDLIISDLLTAYELLPERPIKLTQPSKLAVDGLLARVYLSMEKYKLALLHSERFLKVESRLMNFNELDIQANFPFDRFNKEVAYIVYVNNPIILNGNNYVIDSILYDEYSDNDLRKSTFFKKVGGDYRFKGSYFGAANNFAGIATDEVYFIFAESLIRNGQIIEGLKILDDLLSTRWLVGTYVPIPELSEEDALRLIFKERRKELLFRGLRWGDLKRFNKDARFETKLTRYLNKVEYKLVPNDVRYTLPIPMNEILLTGIEQNPR